MNFLINHIDVVYRGMIVSRIFYQNLIDLIIFDTIVSFFHVCYCGGKTHFMPIFCHLFIMLFFMCFKCIKGLCISDGERKAVQTPQRWFITVRWCRRIVSIVLLHDVCYCMSRVEKWTLQIMFCTWPITVVSFSEFL
jgi:hypothetical protein